MVEGTEFLLFDTIQHTLRCLVLYFSELMINALVVDV